LPSAYASIMLEEIAAEKHLTTTTLQPIKSVLSGIFTLAKNKGAFVGTNPVQDAMIPEHAKDRGSRHLSSPSPCD
jgi:hypothetical protein